MVRCQNPLEHNDHLSGANHSLHHWLSQQLDFVSHAHQIPSTALQLHAAEVTNGHCRRSEIWREPTLRHVVLVGCGVQWFQIITGLMPKHVAKCTSSFVSLLNSGTA